MFATGLMTSYLSVLALTGTQVAPSMEANLMMQDTSSAQSTIVEAAQEENEIEPIVVEAVAEPTQLIEETLAEQDFSTDAAMPSADIAEEVPRLDLPAEPLVFADLSDEEIFENIADYIQSITTLKAQFVQTATSGSVSTGTVYLSRPGRLRFEYDEPVPTLIVATQGLVYVHDKDLETTDSYPVNKTPLKFLLNRKVKTEDAVLKEVLRGQQDVTLVMGSTDEATEGELYLVFSAPDLQLKRWAVRDEMDNFTVLDLDQVEEGIKLARGLYRIPEAESGFTRDR